MTTESPTPALGATFRTTQWTQVMRAKADSKEGRRALADLCQAYWYPLYAYVRRSGYSVHDAQDLTQEFFCQLLEKHWLDAADRTKGKLRSFLITALKHFMANEWRRLATQKRGGGQPHVPLDTALAESRYAADPAAQSDAEELFDQQWALTLLDRTFARLQAEFDADNKASEYEALKGCLMAGRGTIDYAAVAAQLGSNEGAARVAVHRLRARFRAVYREEITQTLADGLDPDEEMRHLAAALSRR
jgi:RNA polymerase sigma-70 factor (ECF subfamily)